MTSTVHTIVPETSFAAIIENMCRFSVCCLPVVESKHKVQSLVTVFDVLRALLKHNSNVSNTSGDTQ